MGCYWVNKIRYWEQKATIRSLYTCCEMNWNQEKIMKRILTTMLIVLLLTACVPSSAAPAPAAVEPPNELITPTAAAPDVKEVAMATQTPVTVTATPEASLPTLNPNQPAPTGTAVGLPKTLAELGIPSTTYRDEVAGLAFDYPSGWTINALDDDIKKTSLGYTTSLRSYMVKPGTKRSEGIPPDMAAMDVTVIMDGPKTYEQAIKERRAAATSSESGQPAKIALEEEWTLPGGLQAHRFLLNLGQDPLGGYGTQDKMISELVTVIDGKMVLVNGFGDLSLYNVVAASLRKIE
jgi:hypothetical protein